MSTHRLRALILAAGLGLVSGCGHCCHRRPCCDGATLPTAPVPAGVAPAPAPAPPAGGAFTPPEPQAPVAPGPATLGIPGTSGFSPMPSAPADLSWQPADNTPPPTVRLRAPEPVTSIKPNQGVRLNPPQVEEKVTPAPRQPSVSEDRSPPPVLPVGIPQFAAVKDKVATGRRPSLDDGLDWLQSNGYRTVLYLRRPGDDDAPDRKEVEKRGLKYLSLEVSPQTLTQKQVEAFNRIVRDAAGYPLFVYDRDGSLAGGLWYLHFRTAEGATDEAARVRAAALGLREDRDSHRDMWVAIRQFLSPPANP